MQGDPLPPTIFNVVLDAFVRHWVNGIVEEEEARGETGREGRHQSAVFYANDSMVISSDPAWLQGAITALVAIFDRAGIMKKRREDGQHGLPPLSGGGRKQDIGGLR